MNVLLSTLILAFQFVQLTANQRPESQQQVAAIHSDKIDLYFQRIALMSILKAKARRIIKTKTADTADELLYFRCANDAKTPVLLAQCVVKLMKARDAKKEREKLPARDPWQTDWFKELRKLFWPSAETPRSFPDSSQGAPIFSPNLDHSKQKLVNSLHTQIRRIKNKHFKYSPTRQDSKKLKNRESPMKRRFYQEPNSGEKLPIEGAKQFANFLKRSDLFSARSKRQATNKTTRFPNIQNLRRIETFFYQSEFIKQYLDRLQKSNQRYLQQFNNSITYNFQRDTTDIIGELNKIFSANPFEKLSILSPRILSLMPPKRKKSGLSDLLSPELLGFHQGGLFSMPSLLKMAASDDKEMLEWLELLMQMSGTGKHLDELMQKMKREMQQVEEVYPKLLKLSRWEKQWSRVLSQQNRRQREDLKRDGFTFINPVQAKRIYNGDKESPYSGMSPIQQDRQLEGWIERIANLEYKKARRRRADTPAPTDGNTEPHFGDSEVALILEPFVFSNQINHEILLEGLILSPHAFVNELMIAETLPYEILSPRAFIASTLSAQMLVSRVLSPAAFRAETVAVTFLDAMVLSLHFGPEAMLSYVIAPRILEARIGSPEAGLFMVLSPGILNPHIYSGEQYALLVLSPHILSPRIESPEQYVVEILSPHIFGGSHETHHEGDKEIAEDHAAGKEVHDRTEPHNTNDDGEHTEQPLESLVGGAAHEGEPH